MAEGVTVSEECADCQRLRDEWQILQSEALSVAVLQTFYSRYKYLIMSRHLASYRDIGVLLAQADTSNLQITAQRFFDLMLNALMVPPTRGGNVNALLHISGYFKRQLSPDEKRSLHDCIESYGRGDVELDVPIALLREQLQRFPNPYLEQQQFLKAI